MKPIKILIGTLTLGLCLSASTWAGSESHGGDGVVVDNKVYLLDLFEAGLEESAYINPQFPGDPAIVQRLNKVFAEFGVPSQMLASKLAEIESVDFYFGRSLLLAMEQISWSLVRAELIEVSDENSPVDLSKLTHIQLAVRTGRDVHINRDGWQKMTEIHRIALVLHETLFALIRLDSEITEKYSNGKVFNVTRYFQDSRKVRSLTGYLFKKSFKNLGIDGLAQKINDKFYYNGSSIAHETNGKIFTGKRLLVGTLYKDVLVWENGKNVSFSAPRDEVTSVLDQICMKYTTSDETRLVSQQQTSYASAQWVNYFEVNDKGPQLSRISTQSYETRELEVFPNNGLPRFTRTEECMAAMNKIVDAFYQSPTPLK